MGFKRSRKPSGASKKSKPSQVTPEDIAAKQDKLDFIKAMAAKASSLESSPDIGIHPSRMGRTNIGTSHTGPPNRRPYNRAMNGHNDRTAAHTNLETRPETNALANPPATNLTAQKKTMEHAGDPKATEKAKNSKDIGKDSKLSGSKSSQDLKADKTRKKLEKQQSRIKRMTKAAQANATSAGETGFSAEDKTELEKATAKAAKYEEKLKSITAKATQQTSESKAKRKAEDVADEETGSSERVSKKPRKSTAAVSGAKDEDKAAKAKRKAAKKLAKQANSGQPEATTVTSEPKSKVSAGQGSATWSSAAASLGSKSSKFMKLLGGAKSGVAAATSESTSSSSSNQARKAERELERQYNNRVQAKSARRTGLGA